MVAPCGTVERWRLVGSTMELYCCSVSIIASEGRTEKEIRNWYNGYRGVARR